MPTRFTSWYSRTRPPLESESTCLSSAGPVMSSVTWAVVGAVASTAPPEASMARRSSRTNGSASDPFT